jgi:hypothetical protein
MSNLYAVFETQFLEQEKNAAIGALFVIDIKDLKGKTEFYKTFRIKRLPDNTTGVWRKGSIGFKLPVLTPNSATIKMYIWNRDAQTFYLDDLQIALYTYQH